MLWGFWGVVAGSISVAGSAATISANTVSAFAAAVSVSAATNTAAAISAATNTAAEGKSGIDNEAATLESDATTAANAVQIQY